MLPHTLGSLVRAVLVTTLIAPLAHIITPKSAYGQAFTMPYREIEICHDPYARSTLSCTLARLAFAPGGAGTQLTVGLTNLQGTPSTSVPFSALYGFRLSLAGPAATTNYTVQSNAVLGGMATGPTGGWTWSNQSVDLGSTGFHSIIGQAVNPIQGCSASIFSGSPVHISTCGRDAWAQFDFWVPNRYELADIRGIFMYDYQLPNVYGPLIAVTGCGYVFSGNQSCILTSDVLVAPEPTTLVLMLAGGAFVMLFGVAFRLRRSAGAERPAEFVE